MKNEGRKAGRKGCGMTQCMYNVLVIHDDDLHLIVNDKGEVDFNLLRPMPGEMVVSEAWPDDAKFAASVARGNIDVKDGRLSRPLEYELKDGTRKYTAPGGMEGWEEFGRLILANVEHHGCWHGAKWSEENWGSMWGAYDSSVTEPDYQGYRFVLFTTSWSQPDVGMMAQLETVCKHPIVMESSNEADGEVYDINGRKLKPEDMVLHKMMYLDGRTGDWEVPPEGEQPKTGELEEYWLSDYRVPDDLVASDAIRRKLGKDMPSEATRL